MNGRAMLVRVILVAITIVGLMLAVQTPETVGAATPVPTLTRTITVSPTITLTPVPPTFTVTRTATATSSLEVVKTY